MKNHRFGKVEKESTRRILYLRAGEEFIGTYERLRITTDKIAVVLSLINGESVEISLPLNPTEEKTLREKFRSIKVGEKISILKIADAKTPVLIRKVLRDKRLAKCNACKNSRTRSRRTQR